MKVIIICRPKDYSHHLIVAMIIFKLKLNLYRE